MTVQLYHGDCLEFMRTLPAGSVDAVVTDPPYLEGDFSHVLDELLRVAKRVVLTPGKIEAFNWIKKQSPVWEYAWRCSGTKSLGGSACLHIGFEPILAYQFPLRPLGIDVLDYPLITLKEIERGHPWPKPVRLFKKLVEHWADPGDIVLDPFMGSGTTGVACVQTGRNFIGCEIDAGYFEIAQRRIALAQQQPLLPFMTNGHEPRHEQLAL